MSHIATVMFQCGGSASVAIFVGWANHLIYSGESAGQRMLVQTAPGSEPMLPRKALLSQRKSVSKEGIYSLTFVTIIPRSGSTSFLSESRESDSIHNVFSLSVETPFDPGSTVGARHDQSPLAGRDHLVYLIRARADERGDPVVRVNPWTSTSQPASDAGIHINGVAARQVFLHNLACERAVEVTASLTYRRDWNRGIKTSNSTTGLSLFPYLYKKANRIPAGPALLSGRAAGLIRSGLARIFLGNAVVGWSRWARLFCYEDPVEHAADDDGYSRASVGRRLLTHNGRARGRKPYAGPATAVLVQVPASTSAGSAKQIRRDDRADCSIRPDELRAQTGASWVLITDPMGVLIGLDLDITTLSGRRTSPVGRRLVSLLREGHRGLWLDRPIPGAMWPPRYKSAAVPVTDPGSDGRSVSWLRRSRSIAHSPVT